MDEVNVRGFDGRDYLIREGDGVRLIKDVPGVFAMRGSHALGWKCLRCWRYTEDDNPVENFAPNSGRLCNRCLRVVAEMLTHIFDGIGGQNGD